MDKKKNIAKFYKQKQVESATPGQLIVLLYEGAIDNLNRAENSFTNKEDKWIETYHNQLINCQNIITELTVSLDMEKGGDISSSLFRLYDYMNYRLIDANIEKDIEPIREVRDLLSNLKSSWVKVAQETSTDSVPNKSQLGLNLKG